MRNRKQAKFISLCSFLYKMLPLNDILPFKLMDQPTWQNSDKFNPGWYLDSFRHPSTLTLHNAKLQRYLSSFIWQLTIFNSRVSSMEFANDENAQFGEEINILECAQGRQG